MKPEHKRASRMMGYTLTLGDPGDWGRFSTFARARLTVTELAGLAAAALGALPEGRAFQVAASILGASGDPLPPFLGGMDDARFWASLATQQELKAYALAAYEAMGARDQAAFFRHISTIEVAA